MYRYDFNVFNTNNCRGVVRKAACTDNLTSSNQKGVMSSSVTKILSFIIVFDASCSQLS